MQRYGTVNIYNVAKCNTGQGQTLHKCNSIAIMQHNKTSRLLLDSYVIPFVRYPVRAIYASINPRLLMRIHLQ